MSDPENEPTSVTCHSFTHARRYPLVIGKIGGFPLPSPLSPAQVAALLGCFFFLLLTRRWWGMLTPGIADAVVLVAAPGWVAWAVRHLRMEGRSPLKMLGGLLSLAFAPPLGVVRGRQLWTKQRQRRISSRIYIIGDTTAAPAEADEPIVSDLPMPPTFHRRPPSPVSDLRPKPRWACLSDEAA